jgi:hypothetical protein
MWRPGRSRGLQSLEKCSWVTVGSRVLSMMAWEGARGGGQGRGLGEEVRFGMDFGGRTDWT